MKINEILIEAYIHSDIDGILKSKGYKFLGSGVDQRVYDEPGTGLVLKIFGTSRGKSGSESELTNAQKSFKTFYDAIKANPGNQFLPNIIAYTPFMFKGKPYLQIRMEKLFPFKGKDVDHWNMILADMADDVERNRFKSGKEFVAAMEKDIDSGYSERYIEQLGILLGGEGLKKLYNTIIMLKKIARKNRYILDLHDGNFMLNSDGIPVISDPFFMGWDRSAE